MSVSRREIRRSLGNLAAITRGRIAGRTYVPHPRRTIFIETSARCNLACRFCAYDSVGPGGFMDGEMFRDIAKQAVGLGFTRIHLTPMLGDLFADPHVMERFDDLEQIPGIADYGFYSNFILPRTSDIARLPQLRKLTRLVISIYGLDEASFELATRKPASQFRKLLTNLEALFRCSADWRPALGLDFSLRVLRTNSASRAELVQLLDQFVAERGAAVSYADDYDSWGGTIAAADVAPLGLKIVDGRHLYMHGACVKTLSEVQILADGRVHACACRDVDGSLIIGDVRDDDLAHILSFANPRYRAIVENQMKGVFGPNCRACSSYRSVYDDRAARNDPTHECMDYATVQRMLNA